ncbi:mobile element protein [Geminocystis sp. NIES-3708]|uniref:hypothetical protein n=1 Tax=Geminocystis sp. NIES-3708 TaxID=1615909 RepID=UPI0005FC4C62|nr:hypothetical protein [Geminocystis sp. NIES-3708]BAQ61879.1 mobile element protein [Geminocystis sp. NIES-3708]
MDLAKWLSVEKQVYLSLRLKKSEYVELETDIWFRLSELGLSPGFSVYYRGIKVTKTKGFSGINLAAKWGVADLRYDFLIKRSPSGAAQSLLTKER